MVDFVGSALELKHQDRIRANADKARGMLSDFAERAASILQELAEYGENERVRMAAANSILDRAGVVTPSEALVPENPEEHALIRQDTLEVLERLEANRAAAKKGPVPLSLEAIVVHEGETTPELT